MTQVVIQEQHSGLIQPELIDSVRETLAEQAAALHNLSQQLDSQQYQNALRLIMNCKGHVILSGMGKSGHVGRKMSATLASTGTPSFFIHPAEAFHGDLGMITPYDLLIPTSASGETDETLQLVPSLKNFGNWIVAITNKGDSTLAQNAEAVWELNMASDSCPIKLAPTTSTTRNVVVRPSAHHNGFSWRISDGRWSWSWPMAKLLCNAVRLRAAGAGDYYAVYNIAGVHAPSGLHCAADFLQPYACAADTGGLLYAAGRQRGYPPTG